MKDSKADNAKDHSAKHVSSRAPLAEAVDRDLLVAEVRVWAQRIGVDDRVKQIHVRPMRRKWASASTQGRLTLSSDLLSQPAEFRREVIVHELVHLKLRHGTHSKLFRALVKTYISQFAEDEP